MLAVHGRRPDLLHRQRRHRRGRHAARRRSSRPAERTRSSPPSSRARTSRPRTGLVGLNSNLRAADRRPRSAGALLRLHGACGRDGPARPSRPTCSPAALLVRPARRLAAAPRPATCRSCARGWAGGAARDPRTAGRCARRAGIAGLMALSQGHLRRAVRRVRGPTGSAAARRRTGPACGASQGGRAESPAGAARRGLLSRRVASQPAARARAAAGVRAAVAAIGWKRPATSPPRSASTLVNLSRSSARPGVIAVAGLLSVASSLHKRRGAAAGRRDCRALPGH